MADGADAPQDEQHGIPVQAPEVPVAQILQQETDAREQEQYSTDLLTLCTSHHGDHLFVDSEIIFLYLKICLEHIELILGID